MAGQLLLVNPRKRRRKTSGRKHRRRRNPRRMTAKQLRYFGPRSARRRRRRNIGSSGSVIAANPHRRRRRVHHVARHRRRRNPVLGGFVTSTVMGAVTGTFGALATDMLWNLIPLPLTMKTGAIGTLAKGAGTIALGMGASKLIGSRLARDAAQGALTVQLYNFVKPMLAGMGIPGLGYYGAGYALNEYISNTPDSLSAFVPNSLTGYEDTSNMPGEDLSMYIRQ